MNERKKKVGTRSCRALRAFGQFTMQKIRHVLYLHLFFYIIDDKPPNNATGRGYKNMKKSYKVVDI